MEERLKRNFYTQAALKLAKNLLGKYIIRRYRNRLIKGRIVETEAYIGPKDKASHSYLGRKTKRNRAEYLAGGHIYIYLVYGMHWQLNISAGKEGSPECVLIRALEPTDSGKQNLSLSRPQEAPNGPGKLCRYLKLNKSFYGEDLTKSERIWLQSSGKKVAASNIVAARRIGIDYAGPYWANKKWRFYIKNSPFVSRK